MFFLLLFLNKIIQLVYPSRTDTTETWSTYLHFVLHSDTIITINYCMALASQ